MTTPALDTPVLGTDLEGNERRKGPGWRRRIRPWAVPTATLILLLAIWEASVRIFEVPSFILPTPSGSIVEGWNFREQLLAHTWITTYETLLGFLLAVVVSIPLAVMIVYSAGMREAVYPLLVALQSVPKIAIAPLLLLTLGSGVLSKVVIAFLVAFFPIVVSTATGLAGTPQELLDLGRAYQAGKLKIFLKVRFPLALPHVFSSFKVGITLAVIGAVVGEFVGSNVGLGYLIVSATAYYNTELAFAAIGILSIISIILFGAIGLIERICCPWYAANDE